MHSLKNNNALHCFRKHIFKMVRSQHPKMLFVFIKRWGYIVLLMQLNRVSSRALNLFQMNRPPNRYIPKLGVFLICMM